MIMKHCPYKIITVEVFGKEEDHIHHCHTNIIVAFYGQ